MSYFGATRAAIAEGRHVICPRFAKFEFDSETVRVWEGVGDILIDAQTWQGMGVLGSVSDSMFGTSDQAGNVTYMLSGVSPEIVVLAREGAGEIRGRPVSLYGRFLSVETLEPLDSTFVLRIDVMDVLSYAGTGPSDRRVTLTAETIWTARNAASFAYFSHKDQQARFSGDLGLERVQLYVPGVRRTWPNF